MILSLFSVEESRLLGATFRKAIIFLFTPTIISNILMNFEVDPDVNVTKG
jgi:hypothetical protein